MANIVRRNPNQPPYPYRDAPYVDPLLQESEASRIDLRRYLMVLLRRKWLILAITVTIAAAAMLESYTVTPLYTASARLQIDPEPTNLLPFQDVYQLSYYSYMTESYQKTQIELLKSRALALRVVKRLDLANDPVFNAPRKPGFFSGLKNKAFDSVFSFVSKTISAAAKAPAPSNYRSKVSVEAADVQMEGVADSFRGGIGVFPVPDTRLMQVTYTSHDPNLAATGLSVLLAEYIEQTFERRLDATQRAQDFLQRQLVDLQKKVEESEERLIAYARDNDIAAINERESTAASTLETLGSELASLESKLIAEAARNDQLKGATVDQFPISFANEAVTKLEQEVFTQQKELSRLTTRFGPEWPEVQQVQRQIDTLRAEIRKEKQRALEKARADYQAALSHRNRLVSAMEEYRYKASKISQGAIQYNILKNEVDTNKNLYSDFLQKLKEAGISAGLEANNIHITEAARAPSTASWPSRRDDAMKGLLFGLLLGVGIAYLLEYLDSALKTPDDVERALGLPALTVIPKLELGWSQRLIPGQVEQGDGKMPKRILYPKTEVWEAYRALRTSLLLSHDGEPPQTILLTSAMPEEGKTTTSLHTAMALAQTGAATVLLDLDLRKPSLGRLLGIYRPVGMTGFLAGESQVAAEIVETGIPNLYFLPSGRHAQNPPELLGSERMKVALRVLRENFKFIVSDSPPVLSVTDPLLLSNIVDGVILVIRGGKTPREAVRKASERIMSVGGHIIGGMINNVDVRKSEYSYYYRYHYYYSDYYSDKRRDAAL